MPSLPRGHLLITYSPRLVFRNRLGGGGLLRDGPGLHRFSAALRLYAQLGLLCRAYQIECASPTTLLASGGQEHGRALGSDRHSDILRIGLGVSGCTAARELLRRGDQQAAEVPDQQLCAPRTYHRANLQVPLAGRTI